MGRGYFLDFLKANLFFGGMGGGGYGDADQVRVLSLGGGWPLFFRCGTFLKRLRGNQLGWGRIGYRQVVEAIANVVNVGLSSGQKTFGCHSR